MYAIRSALLGTPVVGIRNQEDINNVAAHFEVGPEIEKKQTQLVEELGHALATNPRPTLFVLHDTYGLGSPVPSGFSLYNLQSVHVKAACPFLGASEEKLMDSSKNTELKRTLRELGCPPTS